MNYIGIVLSSQFSTLFFVFLISAIGLLLGRIKIRGISLGTSGVLLSALLFGIVFSRVGSFEIGGSTVVLYDALTSKPTYSLISNLGTIFFVAAVGLIAGPTFFRCVRDGSFKYVLLGVCIVGSGVGIMLLLQKITGMPSSLAVGLLTGALTSTPGLSAAKEVAFDTEAVIAGYGIAYIFGVLGVVLFVQLVPRICHVDMEKERAELIAASVHTAEKPASAEGRKIDSLNFFPIMAAIVLGLLIGNIKIPFINFSLGTSGGVLLAGLLLGRLKHIGRINMQVPSHTLAIFRELGLILFLVGAGVPAGVNFAQHVKLAYFIYGGIMTLVPMLIGFVVARFVLKLNVLDCLGAITGGMTSTPALGTLISLSGTDCVVTSYAATYPIALAGLVLAARIVAAL